MFTHNIMSCVNLCLCVHSEDEMSDQMDIMIKIGWFLIVRVHMCVCVCVCVCVRVRVRVHVCVCVYV